MPFKLFLTAFFLLYLGTSAHSTAQIETHLEATSAATLKSLISFLSFPSVSANPARKQETRACANWLAQFLNASRLENVQILESPLHPAVYADWLHAPGKPTVLIYAHYDVQPEEPLNLWHSPPFQPEVRNGRVYARGAADDKGHLFVPVTAVRAYLDVLGKLPLNVKLLLEGEEEIGSPNLVKIMSENRNLLQADFALASDGAQVGPNIPTVVLGARGNTAVEVKISVAGTDMHSGRFGGGVQNPIFALSHVLSTMKDMSTGRVLIDGFYDDVHDVTDEERQDVKDFPVIAESELAKAGVNQSSGELGYNFYERTWYRPSLEIVGITGGHQGIGIKTVLPMEASAKLTVRMVSKQTSVKVIKALREHLHREASKVPGVKVETFNVIRGCDPFITDRGTTLNQIAKEVLTSLYGREPVYKKMGGSIPVLTQIKDVLGMEMAIFAFADGHENIHAPNEFSELSSYRRGEVAYVRMLDRLATAWTGNGDVAKDDL